MRRQFRVITEAAGLACRWPSHGGMGVARRLRARSVRVIRSATSLGGVESTIERRAKLPGQQHLPPGFLRLSVGCEHIEDLWDDLPSALAQTGA